MKPMLMLHDLSFSKCSKGAVTLKSKKKTSCRSNTVVSAFDLVWQRRRALPLVYEGVEAGENEQRHHGAQRHDVVELWLQHVAFWSRIVVFGYWIFQSACEVLRESREECRGINAVLPLPQSRTESQAGAMWREMTRTLFIYEST